MFLASYRQCVAETRLEKREGTTLLSTLRAIGEPSVPPPCVLPPS